MDGYIKSVAIDGSQSKTQIALYITVLCSYSVKPLVGQVFHCPVSGTEKD